MAEKDNSAIGLTSEQATQTVEGLNKQGATFFTWEQLQNWIKRFGSKAKVSDVQENLKKIKDKEIKQ